MLCDGVGQRLFASWGLQPRAPASARNTRCRTMGSARATGQAHAAAELDCVAMLPCPARPR
eukprot:13865364-Alexandrium_andersonii.AAC.1